MPTPSLIEGACNLVLIFVGAAFAICLVGGIIGLFDWVARRLETWERRR